MEERSNSQVKDETL